MPPLRPPQLRSLLLLRRLSSSPPPHPSGAQCRRLLLPHSPPSFPPRIAPAYSPRLPRLSDFSPLHRSFSSAAADAVDRSGGRDRDRDEVARSISAELTAEAAVEVDAEADAEGDALSVVQRLALNFSHVTPDPGLILSTLNLSPDAGRAVLGFYQWLAQNPDFAHTDETLSMFVDYLGRRKDFKAIDELMSDAKDVASSKTRESVIDRLVRAGRPVQAVEFFERMERDYGLKRDKESMKMVVEKLCEKGYASCAEKMVKNLAHEFFPDEHACDMLIKGWCVAGKLDEANRLAREMYRGGFEIGTAGYNALLDCVCKLCRKKDPFQLNSQAEQILVDMDYYGVPRNVETFNVLIGNLCKIRKTEDAMKLFHRMGEWGCYPNEETFLVLTRSLYQAARVGEGDEMIDRMKSAGYALDRKAYYGFLKILCGIERIDHALTVFKKMKADGCEPGIKTYDLLMGKSCAHNRLDKANALFNEALRRGVPVEPKPYRLDPRFMKKPKAEKKEKKRETLPEKMARKRRRLKQIRLSFVKKPKRMMRGY